MSCYIVPNWVSDAIDKRLDEALAQLPDAEQDREFLRGQLIEAFAEYGTIPEFSIEKRAEGASQ